MEITKKIARKAAAEFSADPVRALLRFRELLVKYDCDVPSDVKELESQFYRLLKPYRHPVKDKLTESLIFIDPEGGSIQMTGYSDLPSFLEDLEGTDVDIKLRERIKEFCIEYERTKIELNVQKSEKEGIENLIGRARAAYKNTNHENTSSRKTAAVQALGLSDGKKPQIIDHDKAWYRYVQLIRKRGLSRESALIDVKTEFGYNSYSAAIKALHVKLHNLKEKWKTLSPQKSNVATSKLRGIIPQDR